MEAINNVIQKLRQDIRYHEYLYYILNDPIISDYEFDLLMIKLKTLEIQHKQYITKNSPTQQIFSGYIFNKKNTQHFVAMLSLDSVFNEISYVNFQEKINKKLNINKSHSMITMCCELKLDGVALNLIYKKGRLIQALTRGNGFIGEDVTDNALKIKSIPHQLYGEDIPSILEIRGEVLMSRSGFMKLNKTALINGKKCLSNLRNAAAGSLRQNNADITKNRHLIFFSYGYGVFQDYNDNLSHYNRLLQIQSWGIPICKLIKCCIDIKQVISFYKDIQIKRDFLDYDIDGIVIKVDNIKFQKQLGNSSRSPRWAIAYKFPPKENVTRLLDVVFMIGRTGIITPVAILKPIFISGVLVKKANLYNKNEIERLGLFIGDKVVVCRSGDVIPKILYRIQATSLINKKKISFPKRCPTCDSVLRDIKDNNLFYCPSGLFCKSQKKYSIVHFFSKNGLYVEGLGVNVIDNLIRSGCIKNICDVFYLTIESITRSDNIGVELGSSLIKSILNCRMTTLSRFIYALGINGVGIVNSKYLAEHFLYFKNIMDANIVSLRLVKNIGKIVACNIYNFMRNELNKKTILTLLHDCKIVITPIKNKKNIHNDSLLYQKNIVLTGKFNMFTRKQMIKKLILIGANVKRYVSNKIDFLIIGTKPSKKKLLEAFNFKIEILNEKKIMSFLKK